MNTRAPRERSASLEKSQVFKDNAADIPSVRWCEFDFISVRNEMSMLIEPKREREEKRIIVSAIFLR